MASAVMGVPAPTFQPHPAACAPSDYADLMDELMACRTPEDARLWRYGTVARRHALPQPWQNAVNAALSACEQIREAANA